MRDQNLIADWPLRNYLWLVWIGFGVLACVFTFFFYAWQGFSPDGPPPGFNPEPIGLFVLKYFPLVLLGLAIQVWWFSIPLLAITLWEIFRVAHPHISSSASNSE